MTQWTPDRGWKRRWQLALPIGLGISALVGRWGGPVSWSALPRAVAQTADAVPFQAVPSEIDPAELDAAAAEVPELVTDNALAEASRPHVGPIAGWRQESNDPAPAAEPPLLEPVPLAEAPADEEATQRVHALLDQYDRVRRTLPEEVPSTEITKIPAGPPRMDSGDPDPDRLQSPPPHPVPSEETQLADLSDAPPAPPATDPTPRRNPGAANPGMGQ